MKIALKIRPQRSTQYTNMVETLAIPELLASPVGMAIQEVTPVTLAGQGYLLATLKTGETEDAGEIRSIQEMLPTLSRLGATSEVYQYFARLGEIEGPLLRPLEPQFRPFIPLEMSEARRYKGKTNEIFSQVLLNVAIFAGAYAQEFTSRLRILDPLAGGGTTLFLAVAAGHDALGIELERQDIETTAGFILHYLPHEHIPIQEFDERGRKAGRRYQFEIGTKKETRTLGLAHGDTAQTRLHMQEVPGGPRMHAVLGDLPYGIQHFGEIASLLQKALSAWEQLLLPGGTLALAWNAT